MEIGTPLSDCSTRVMLLGSGELGKEVIIALQRLGVEVIAVDRYANAPGQQVAHRAHVINMADPDQLKQVIESEKPDLVVPEIEALSTDTLAEIEQQGIATVIPTARAAQLTMNREGIRRLVAEELNIPTSKYAFADSLELMREIIEEQIPCPCIIKPVTSSSGKGQSSVNMMEDIESAWDYAMSGGRISHERIIIEERIEFDFEITLLTVRAKDSQGQVQTYFCEPVGHRQELGDYVESWQPQPMSPVAQERCRDIAKRVTDNLGGQGLFGVELFVKGDDVWFSEVSPRPHDTGMVTMVTQAQNEFELHTRAILGLPVDTSLRNPGASAVIYGGVEGTEIIYSGLEEALAEPGTDIRLFGKPEAFERRRMGVCLASATDIDTARTKAKQAASKVKTRLAE